MWGLEEPEELRGGCGCSGSPQNTGGWDRGNPHPNGALGTRLEHVEIPFSEEINPMGALDNQNLLGRRPSSLGI